MSEEKHRVDHQRIAAAVREMLLAIGEDPDRDGLRETPDRVARMYEETLGNIHEDPSKHIKLFEDSTGNDEMVVVKEIPLYSMCEHHLLPFIGVCHIAYIPTGGRVLGLSKFARIVDCFARRPQVQERLTNQIADFIEESLQPKGVAVIIEAEHLCMSMRGVRASGSRTQTSALRGRMRSDARSRAEVLSLLTS
ncbi:MAG: GTP cyclohydrolase I FolE [Ruminococcaceae bacterium]|nr:GTP cyclohydrolase I FolE [Oscillospiraceae bacterium]